ERRCVVPAGRVVERCAAAVIVPPLPTYRPRRAGGRAPLQEVQHAGQRRGAGVRRPQGGVPAVGAVGARCQEGRRTDFVQAEKAVRDGVARTVVVAG
ncbi:hypothetical protein, partial [Streptomyces anthocyanicus]